MSERSEADVANDYIGAVLQAIVELGFFEGYFEAQNEHGGDSQDLRDRAGRARMNLQASWLDVIKADS